MQREEENSRQKVMNFSSQVQSNECQLRSEEAKLNSTRRDFTSVCEKIRTLESEHDPEPTDVLALVFCCYSSLLFSRLANFNDLILIQEEDLLEVEQKLEKNENEHQVKTALLEELKQELQKLRQTSGRSQKEISLLTAETQPLKVINFIHI